MSRYQLRASVRSKLAEHSIVDIDPVTPRHLRRRNTSVIPEVAQPLKAPSAVATKPKLRFLALPLEVRHQIYLHLTYGTIVSKDRRHRSYSETDLDAKRLSLLFVNRQLHHEFRPIILDNVVFKVSLSAAFQWSPIKHFAINIARIRQSAFPTQLSEVAMRANYHKLLPSLVPLPSRLESVTLFVGPGGKRLDGQADRAIVEKLGLPEFGHMVTGRTYIVNNPGRHRLDKVLKSVVHDLSVQEFLQFVGYLWERNVVVSLEVRPESDCGRACQIVFKTDWTFDARAVRPADMVVDSSHSWNLPRGLRYSQEYLHRVRAEVVQ